MKVKSESEVAQSCLTLSDPMDCSLPGSSIHGIFQARVVEWGATAFSMGGSYLASKRAMSGRCGTAETQRVSQESAQREVVAATAASC